MDNWITVFLILDLKISHYRVFYITGTVGGGQGIMDVQSVHPWSVHHRPTGGSNKNQTSHHWINLSVTWWTLIVRTPCFGVRSNRCKRKKFSEQNSNLKFSTVRIQIWKHGNGEKFKSVTVRFYDKLML